MNQRGTSYHRIWDLLRMNSEISRDEILQLAAVSRDHAETYLRELHRAGYIKKVRRIEADFHTRKQWVYKLLEDTGPLPPRIIMVAMLYDPNLEETVSDIERLMKLTERYAGGPNE